MAWNRTNQCHNSLFCAWRRWFVWRHKRKRRNWSNSDLFFVWGRSAESFGELTRSEMHVESSHWGKKSSTGFSLPACRVHQRCWQKARRGERHWHEQTAIRVDDSCLGVYTHRKREAFILVTSRSRPFALQNMQADIVFCVVEVLGT